MVDGNGASNFTKRPNWSQFILEGLRDFLHVMNSDGKILYASPSCKAIAGYERAELVGRFITEFIHPNDRSIFNREFAESIGTGNRIRFFYRFLRSDSGWIIFETQGHSYNGIEPAQNLLSNTDVKHRECIMMARLYQTRTTAAFDSFLELKIENERLAKRIAKLKREEKEAQDAEEVLEAQYQTSKARERHSPNIYFKTPFLTHIDSHDVANYRRLPPFPLSILNSEATEQTMGEEPPVKTSKNLDNKDSPSTRIGDLGIPISKHREKKPYSKKKKNIELNIGKQYMCTSCNTVDSPEWRRGPTGPKTLCNACGLRWSKEKKKKRDVSKTTAFFREPE
ncbi:white collar 2 type of transcription factor [Kalmusia sp. IMI 367209]|nr:white collar 2 type of transcription factor [Kalmusia sp. IMI 367209]